MARIAVVTGGAGFIGSHVVDLLIERGLDVHVIDNFSTGRPENLAHLKGHPRLSLLQADVNEPSTAAMYEGAEWVLHLAALADIVPSIQNPVAYHHANVNGTVSVLEHSRRAGVKRFVYAASSSCYGIPDVYPTPETSSMDPRYPYALTKYLGEQYVLGWEKIYGLPAVSLRFFNVYGTRSRTSGTYGAVFGVFLAQKIHGKPYTVVGDGSQSRDFTYVTDVARAVVDAAASDLRGEILNVGSGGHYSVNRLVELLGGEKVYVPKRPGEPEITFADITKIRRMLNWSPRVTLEDGVARMLEQLDYWKKAPVWTPESISDATRDWFKYLK